MSKQDTSRSSRSRDEPLSSSTTYSILGLRMRFFYEALVMVLFTNCASSFYGILISLDDDDDNIKLDRLQLYLSYFDITINVCHIIHAMFLQTSASPLGTLLVYNFLFIPRAIWINSFLLVHSACSEIIVIDICSLVLGFSVFTIFYFATIFYKIDVTFYKIYNLAVICTVMYRMHSVAYFMCHLVCVCGNTMWGWGLTWLPLLFCIGFNLTLAKCLAHPVTQFSKKHVSHIIINMINHIIFRLFFALSLLCAVCFLPIIFNVSSMFILCTLSYSCDVLLFYVNVEEPRKNIRKDSSTTNEHYNGPGNDNSYVPVYPIHFENRGEVLIINNIMFENASYRNGAEKDDENLKNLFSEMGFIVDVKRNKKKSEMIDEVRRFSKKSSLENADIAIVVIMSHGTRNKTLRSTEVIGVDDQGILIAELINFFDEKYCTSMINKPKIFIFQCCRGDNENYIEIDSVNIPSNVEPLTNNALIVYSTLPGFVSYRDPEHGTWFISTICDVFRQHAHEYHVEELLKMVDEKLATYDRNNRIRQTIHYQNKGFNKLCYLYLK